MVKEGIKMPKLPDIDLNSIPPVASDLPSGRYLVTLVEVEKYTAKKSGRPCLRWWCPHNILEILGIFLSKLQMTAAKI